MTSAADNSDELLFTRIGANDPEFNLRRDAAFMIRRHADTTVFATVVEPHGSYSPVTENALNSRSQVAEFRIVHDDADYTAVSIEHVNGGASVFILANSGASTSKKHRLNVGGRTYRWTGPFHYTQID